MGNKNFSTSWLSVMHKYQPCHPFSLSSLAYPNLLGTKGYVVVVARPIRGALVNQAIYISNNANHMFLSRLE
jgi:hypothetical protein